MKTLTDYISEGEIKLKDFSPRAYQENIFNTATKKNTLVVLPTGMGKTFIFLLLGIHRLNKFPNSKILLCSPTKPLSHQIHEVFKKHTNIKETEIVLLTGAISPKKRSELWEKARVITATPQTIQFDLANKRISLENVSLLTLDEAHRSRMKYANTIIAKDYIKNSLSPRILALTASPGGTKEKIKEICTNLFIEEVEIRTEDDEDVQEYVEKKQIDLIHVELPKEFIEIKNLIKSVYSDKVISLKKFGITKPASVINKKDLIALQFRFRKEISQGNKAAFSGISMAAQALKLSHALELLETQGLESLKKFLEKLQGEDTKASKVIMNDSNILRAEILTKQLINNNIKHPKIDKLCEIIKEELSKNPNSKIIVFANFRFTVRELVNTLKKIEGVKPVELMGQKEGITQKKQIQTIKDFESGVYNTLICTSVGEEGLDILGCDTAVFFDHVATSIRRIQRTGRVGRIRPGKIIFLITKNTRDAAYYWKSQKDEKRMKYILKESQNKYLTEKQTELK